MISNGQDLGINGTPTFVIGVVGDDNKFRVAKLISGAKAYAVFKDAIDSVLASTQVWVEGAPRSRPAVTSSGREANHR